MDRPRGDIVSIPPGSQAKLSDVVYARLAAGIADGGYPLGGRLPAENELADTLAVSRPIVREALSRLRDDGLVVSRRGSGTYVRRVPLAADRNLAALSSIADMRRCLEYRISFEGEMAWHAALNLTPAGETQLASALSKLSEDLEKGELPVEDDFNFHFAIARATENRFFAGAMANMREPVASCMAITRSFVLLGTVERLRELNDEHAAVFEAIRRRDGDAARAAMRRHLDNAMARAFEGTMR